MAERPIFIPTSEEDGYVRRIDFEFRGPAGLPRFRKRRTFVRSMTPPRPLDMNLSWRFRPNPTRWRDVT